MANRNNGRNNVDRIRPVVWNVFIFGTPYIILTQIVGHLPNTIPNSKYYKFETIRDLQIGDAA